MSYTVLFVRGPLHGEFRIVERLTPYVVVPIMGSVKPKLAKLEEPCEPLSKVDYKEIEYKLGKAVTSNGVVFNIYYIPGAKDEELSALVQEFV